MPNRPDDLVVSVEPQNDGGASPLATGPSQVEPWDDDDLQARMAAMIDRGAGECWLWTGATARGRANISYRGRSMSAPRLAKVISDRAWPPVEMQACHECDNPACVKADHIWWGTNRENSLDAVRKGRFKNQSKTHCVAGHPLSGENLRHSKEGHRICRICAAKRQKQWRDKK